MIKPWSLLLALALAACTAPGTPPAPTASVLATGDCESEGFSVNEADEARYQGADAHVMHAGEDHGTPAAEPAGETRCVPVQALEAPIATTSLAGRYQLTVESLRGPLTADAAENEAFAVTLVDAASGQPIEGAAVTLEFRMPHHNRTNVRGHGPANDPEAQGFPATARAGGGYAVDPVDFSMAGPWLVTARVRVGDQTDKAYWGLTVK